MSGKVYVKLASYDVACLESAMKSLLNKVERETSMECIGPVPLPSKMRRFVVTKGPHADKRGGDTYEICEHVRLLLLKTKDGDLDVLKDFELSPGVNVNVKVDG